MNQIIVMASNQHSGGEPAVVPVFAERHYSVPEIAKMWNLAPVTVTELFENEPGVMIIGGETKGRMSRRKYRTFRIPEHVVERVYLRRTSKVG